MAFVNLGSFRLFSAAALSAIVFSGVAVAATQGTLGTTSTGSVNINVTKPARASITNLSDMTVTNWLTGGGDQVLTNDVCVYSTRPSGGYTIRASGSGVGGGFLLANGALTLPYSVVWNSGGVGALANTGTTLTPNITSSGLTKASTTSSTCNGSTPGPTARLVVTLLAANLEAAADGTYTGSLTLIVTPN